MPPVDPAGRPAGDGAGGSRYLQKGTGAADSGGLRSALAAPRQVASLFARAWGRFFPRPQPFFMNQNPAYAPYQIGDWSYGIPTVMYDEGGQTLVMGRFCSIAKGVTIYLGGNHRTDWVTTYPFSEVCEDARGFTGHPQSKGDVVIGNDVWIGRDALILSGVHIGDGAVVAARSVVAKDVAPYTIVVGNPARCVRQRFPDHIVEALLEIAWWDWPMERIKEAWPLLLSGDIQKFVDSFHSDGR